MNTIFLAGQTSAILGAGRKLLLWEIAVATGVPYILLYKGHRETC